MPYQRVSCVYRRNMFFGLYEIVGEGAGMVVRVRYNGAQLATRADDFSAEVVAESVLTCLVVREVLAMRRVSASSQTCPNHTVLFEHPSPERWPLRRTYL